MQMLFIEELFMQHQKTAFVTITMKYK